MKVTDISPMKGEYVDTDDPDYPSYRRLCAESWEMLMGASWEDVGDTEELEAAYQAFKKEHGI